MSISELLLEMFDLTLSTGVIDATMFLGTVIAAARKGLQLPAIPAIPAIGLKKKSERKARRRAPRPAQDKPA